MEEMKEELQEKYENIQQMIEFFDQLRLQSIEPQLHDPILQLRESIDQLQIRKQEPPAGKVTLSAPSIQKILAGYGLYVYHVTCLTVKFVDPCEEWMKQDWCVVKVGKAERRTLRERLAHECNDINRWRGNPQPCIIGDEVEGDSHLIACFPGLSFTLMETYFREQLGLPLGQSKVVHNDSVVRMQGEHQWNSKLEKFTLKHGEITASGWARFLFPKDRSRVSQIGPTEFIMMPNDAMNELRRKFWANPAEFEADVHQIEGKLGSAFGHAWKANEALPRSWYDLYINEVEGSSHEVYKDSPLKKKKEIEEECEKSIKTNNINTWNKKEVMVQFRDDQSAPSLTLTLWCEQNTIKELTHDEKKLVEEINKLEVEISEADELFQKSKTTVDEIATSLETAKEEAKAMNKEASGVFEAAKKVYEAAKAKSKEHTVSLTAKYEAAKTEMAQKKKNKAEKKKNLGDIKKKLTALKKSKKAENKKTNKDVSDTDEGSGSQNTDTKPVDADAQKTTSKESEETSSDEMNDGFPKNSAHGIAKEAIGDLVEDTFGQENNPKKVQAKS